MEGAGGGGYGPALTGFRGALQIVKLMINPIIELHGKFKHTQLVNGYVNVVIANSSFDTIFHFL